MEGILLLGKICTLPFHSASPCEMEQSKFYLAIIFLPFHSEPLNICILILFTMQSCNSYYMVSSQTVFTYPLHHAKLQILQIRGCLNHPTIIHMLIYLQLFYNFFSGNFVCIIKTGNMLSWFLKNVRPYCDSTFTGSGFSNDLLEENRSYNNLMIMLCPDQWW